ncbi:MAG: hypothetical protein RMK52_01270 [Chitinophagales bacterium]|nr:hypothetical protein [Chitinophagales bacterium]MDW8392856.1 hypothetical protein [Chitinophagales bacterium]
MKLFFGLLVGAVLLQMLLPWWSMAVWAFVLAVLLADRPVNACAAGLVAGGFSWLLPALWLFYTRDHRLADQLAQVFQLPSAAGLFVMAFLIAGLVTGLAALSGAFVRMILLRKHEKPSARPN